MWCKMVTQQLQGDHRGFLLFRKSHNPTKRDKSIQKWVFFFFSKCVFENGNSVRPDNGSQHAPRRIRCKHFNFFQNRPGHFQKCILGVSLKHMNITWEMRTHNIEYGLVSFTVRHSTSENNFTNIYKRSTSSHEMHNFPGDLLIYCTAGVRQRWPSDYCATARTSLHCALHISTASLKL